MPARAGHAHGRHRRQSRHPRRAASARAARPAPAASAPPSPVQSAAPSARARSLARVFATILAVAGPIVLGLAVAIDRDAGHGLEAFGGALGVLLGLAGAAGVATVTMTIGGLGEFVVGDLPGRSAKAWALRGMRLATAAAIAITGGLFIAQAVGTVGSTLLVRGFAVALVPMSLAFAFMRWVLREELAAASEAAKQVPHGQTITVGVPKPSQKLRGALLAEIARHPAVHALLSLGVAAFLVLTAASPSLASSVSHVVSYPWHLVDSVADQILDWATGLF